MSDFLSSKKQVFLTQHLMLKWADRIAAERSLKEVTKNAEVINKIKEVLSARSYKLVNDGSEFNGKKYRLVCKINKVCTTFVVIDTTDALIFKSVWKAKGWEEKYLKEVK